MSISYLHWNVYHTVALLLNRKDLSYLLCCLLYYFWTLFIFLCSCKLWKKFSINDLIRNVQTFKGNKGNNFLGQWSAKYWYRQKRDYSVTRNWRICLPYVPSISLDWDIKWLSVILLYRKRTTYLLISNRPVINRSLKTSYYNVFNMLARAKTRPSWRRNIKTSVYSQY